MPNLSYPEIDTFRYRGVVGLRKVTRAGTTPVELDLAYGRQQCQAWR